MKFSTSAIIALIGLAASVSAAPALDKRQTTPFSVIDTTLTSLQSTLAVSEQAIKDAAIAAKNDISATVQVAAAINANLQGIVDSIKAATTTILGATAGTLTGLLTGTITLTQAQIDQLANDLIILQNIINGISATLTVTATNLTPAAQALIFAEILQVEAIIQPLVAPIAIFANAVKNAAVAVNLGVTGLKNALAGVQTIITNLLTSLGLQILAGHL